MILLACLPPERLERLRAALGDLHRVIAAADWEHADAVVRREPVDVIVADPAFGGGVPAAGPVARLRARYPSVGFVLYARLDATTVGPLATLGRDGIEHLVLFDVDDDPWHLRRVLAVQPGVALAARLLERLEPALRFLSTEVAGAIARVVRTPAAFHGVPDLAAAAGVSRRTIYRECERARLASPRELIAAARVLRAYALLRESDHAIETVAAALRFSSTHHLTRTMRWACGLTTARARERIAPDAMIDRLLARLLPDGPPAAAPARPGEAAAVAALEARR